MTSNLNLFLVWDERETQSVDKITDHKFNLFWNLFKVNDGVKDTCKPHLHVFCNGGALQQVGLLLAIRRKTRK